MPVEIKIMTADKSAKKTMNLGGPASNDDKPGYGKPPKQHQWKPGQSGNPSGKPKGAKNLATVVKDEAKGKVTIKDASGGSKKLSKIEAMVRTLFHKALKGDTKSISLGLALFKEHLPEEVEAQTTLATEEELQLLTDHAALLGLLNSLTEVPAPSGTDNTKTKDLMKVGKHTAPAQKDKNND